MSSFVRTLGLLAAIIFVITVSVVVFIYPRAGRIVAALSPQPETLTELYFEDHLRLPTLVAFNTPFEFTITIHNLEQREVAYPVEVTVTPEDQPNQTTVLWTRAILVKHDQTRSIPVQISLPVTEATRVKVQVKLVNLDQSIHFWLKTSEFLLMTPSPSATGSARPTAPVLQAL